MRSARRTTRPLPSCSSSPTEWASSCWTRRSTCGRRRRQNSITTWTGTRGTCATCRSEEHTSELQSRLHLVCRLLLEKKKKKKKSDEDRNREKATRSARSRAWPHIEDDS